MALAGAGSHEGGTHSEVAGIARNILQARDVSGGVHFHHAGAVPGPVPRQLPAAIADFTERLSGGLRMFDSISVLARLHCSAGIGMGHIWAYRAWL